MKIEDISSLRSAIKEMEVKSNLQKKNLADQIEEIKPSHVIKTAFNKLTTSSHIQNKILNGTIGVITGVLSKRLLMGRSHSFLAKISGKILEFIVAKVIIKNASKIKSVGQAIIKNIT